MDTAHLREKFGDRAILPDDAEYDAARTVFYGGIDRKPLAIVRVQDTSDVATTIALAQEAGVPLAVRSGGHSLAGYGVCEGGIVIDLKNMKKLEIDVQGRTAWAETGLTAREYTLAVDGHDLATGFGDTGSVGIGGITLSGGIGFLVRKYGMTIDNVLAAEIVTADGKTLMVDADNYPDLFWAIRGGGGNYGVVTKFQYRLQLVDSAVGGMLLLPATPEVMVGFMEAAAAAPDELSTIMNVMPCPPMPFVSTEQHGKMIVMALMMYAGDQATGEQVLVPFRKLATPIADMLKPMRYPEIFFPDDNSYHPTAVAHNMFIKSLDTYMATHILEQLAASDAPMRVVQLRALGGAMGRVARDATAFAHRSSPIMVNVASFYTGEEDKLKRESWVRELVAHMNQGDNGAYVGFLADEGEERVRAAYPEATWKKLQEVKRKYDPKLVFKMNHTVTL